MAARPWRRAHAAGTVQPAKQGSTTAAARMIRIEAFLDQPARFASASPGGNPTDRVLRRQAGLNLTPSTPQVISAQRMSPTLLVVNSALSQCFVLEKDPPAPPRGRFEARPGQAVGFQVRLEPDRSRPQVFFRPRRRNLAAPFAIWACATSTNSRRLISARLRRTLVALSTRDVDVSLNGDVRVATPSTLRLRSAANAQSATPRPMIAVGTG